MQTIDPGSTVEITEEEPQLHDGALGRVPGADDPRRLARPVCAVGLYLIDSWWASVAASSALFLRFGSYGAQPFLLDYLLLTLLFPLAWIAVLALNRAYEARHLFVGTDEYARVVRSGLGLTAALAIFSFAFDLRLARGYVIIALPLATAVDVGARYPVPPAAAPLLGHAASACTG